MNIEPTQKELEQLIAASAPEPYAPEGLKLQILREAKQQEHRLQSRNMLTGAIASCLLLFIFTESNLHTVSHASQQIASNFIVEPASLSLCQLKLSGEEVGSWSHVDAVLKYRSDVKQLLRPLSSTTTVATLPVGSSFF